MEYSVRSHSRSHCGSGRGQLQLPHILHILSGNTVLHILGEFLLISSVSSNRCEFSFSLGTIRWRVIPPKAFVQKKREETPDYEESDEVEKPAVKKGNWKAKIPKHLFYFIYNKRN